MIINKISILQWLSPSRRAQQRLATRWMAAGQREPELVQDVIRMSGILPYPAKRLIDGVHVPEAVDPINMAKEQGRREFGVELLALIKITPFELSTLVESNNDVD